MMCSAYFGELSEERKKCWNCEDHDPYHVLQTHICLERKGHELLDAGAKYFSDMIKVDWGSFAWKCTPEELYRFLNDHKTKIPWLIESEEDTLEKVKAYVEERENTEFGIVFIEEC